MEYRAAVLKLQGGHINKTSDIVRLNHIRHSNICKPCPRIRSTLGTFMTSPWFSMLVEWIQWIPEIRGASADPWSLPPWSLLFSQQKCRQSLDAKRTRQRYLPRSVKLPAACKESCYFSDVFRKPPFFNYCSGLWIVLWFWRKQNPITSHHSGWASRVTPLCHWSHDATAHISWRIPWP